MSNVELYQHYSCWQIEIVVVVAVIVVFVVVVGDVVSVIVVVVVVVVSTGFVVKPEGGQQCIFEVILTKPMRGRSIKTWGLRGTRGGLTPPEPRDKSSTGCSHRRRCCCCCCWCFFAVVFIVVVAAIVGVIIVISIVLDIVGSLS